MDLFPLFSSSKKMKENISSQQKTTPSQLSKEMATAPPFGIRDPFSQMQVAPFLTPKYLETILNALNSGGDASSYLTLAIEMEERDPHYASVLHTRKQAVASLKPILTPSTTDHPLSEKVTHNLKKLIENPLFTFLLYDLLDALGKGYSITEIIWQTKNNIWFPKSYIHKDPRWFRYDKADGRTLKLIGKNNMDDQSLLPYKYIVHQSHLRCGSPSRSGLARLVSTSYMLKSYTLNAWASFIDVAGLPMRLGKYDASATKEDVEQLKRAVSHLGTDTGAVIPEAMQIEFISNPNAQGLKGLFSQLATYLDQQISKAVLGQTMTTDQGSSHAQALVHNEVRKSLVSSDAHLLAHTLRRDLLTPFIQLNFGADVPIPQLHFEEAPQIAPKILIEAVKELIPLGFDINHEKVLEKLGLH